MALYRSCPYGPRAMSTGSHCSSSLGSLEPLPSLFIEAKGGGKGYWHDMPSIGQAHGVHGWHSCLNGLGRVILSYWAKGSRH